MFDWARDFANNFFENAQMRSISWSSSRPLYGSADCCPLSVWVSPRSISSTTRSSNTHRTHGRPFLRASLHGYTHWVSMQACRSS